VEGVLAAGRKAAVCGDRVRRFRHFPARPAARSSIAMAGVDANFCFSNRFFSSVRSSSVRSSSVRSGSGCCGEAAIGRMDSAGQVGANHNSVSTLAAVRSRRQALPPGPTPADPRRECRHPCIELPSMCRPSAAYAKPRVCQAAEGAPGNQWERSGASTISPIA
jgi:hypothetical protein